MAQGTTRPQAPGPPDPTLVVRSWARAQGSTTSRCAGSLAPGHSTSTGSCEPASRASVVRLHAARGGVGAPPWGTAMGVPPRVLQPCVGLQGDGVGLVRLRRTGDAVLHQRPSAPLEPAVEAHQQPGEPHARRCPAVRGEQRHRRIRGAVARRQRHRRIRGAVARRQRGDDPTAQPRHLGVQLPPGRPAQPWKPVGMSISRATSRWSARPGPRCPRRAGWSRPRAGWWSPPGLAPRRDRGPRAG